TDGLIEIPGTDIDDTTDHLAHHLSQTPAQDLDDLANSLIRHAEQSAAHHDDIALLLIRPHKD
ncbi:SpoIIE family protein phosphatase, partial [Streptomyces sp. NPDC086077]|uniref:SpoIIE family protein phosphatase n=1 Tax=Streptomyces sp. NPDC086077 TaxID=3154862 RepID=UPI00341735F3